MAGELVAHWMSSRLSFPNFSNCFCGHTSPGWTKASLHYATLSAHRLQGRHLLLIQTNRDRTSLLWASVFTKIAARCSQCNPNVNNQYLKRHKPFPWEPGSSQRKTSHSPSQRLQFLYSPSFWVTNAVPLQELAWEMSWIGSCWPDAAYLAGLDFLALFMILYSRSRAGGSGNRSPCSEAIYKASWEHEFW